MKKLLLFLYLSSAFFLVSCVSSCKYKSEYQIVNAKNEFTVSVPSWMKEEENLATGAPFQYANRFRNFYAVGFVMKKDTAKLPFDTYWNSSLLALKSSVKTPLVTDSLSLDVNGMKGMRAEILGTMDGEKIFFSEIMLDGKTKYYHLSIWVRGEERKLHFKEDINKIIGSLKEL